MEYEFSRYKNTEAWDKDVPPDLVPAIEALRKSFDTAHWKCGQITKVFCFAQLHPGAPGGDTKDYLTPLHQLQAMVGPVAAQHFAGLLRENTPSAIFRAYYDLYVGAVAVQVVDNLAHLIGVGEAQEARLKRPSLEWAAAQTKHMIRSHVHSIDIWLRDVCDKDPYDPTKDSDEQIFWKSWQAPQLLLMKPARSQAYDRGAVWDRLNPETTRGVRRAFVDDYVLSLEGIVSRLVGERAVQLAKRPIAVSKPEIRTPDANLGQKVTHVRREARKLQTKTIHTKWQQEYRHLTKIRPGMSDLWYSRQIAKGPIANGRRPETIRKHMKK
jgi:hypothetical protein